MTYRWLEPEEWDALRPLFEQNGQEARLPSPAVAKAVVAETEEGEIAACLLLQVALHAEPLVIDPRYRGSVRFTRLFDTVNGAAGSGGAYYCFTTDDLTTGMARMAGLTELPYRVFVKEF
jgi:hypothetical protein